VEIRAVEDAVRRQATSSLPSTLLGSHGLRHISRMTSVKRRSHGVVEMQGAPSDLCLGRVKSIGSILVRLSSGGRGVSGTFRRREHL
jgi:hypothetical protein